ncbi:hypothetical protein LARV_01931 [Longilinea arvoryzae]|uniref:HTH cro/C1-type domain-containing protein n=1 Tax=Longilinea arvoryzae TaxID=360412 RepID=A0A0S7BK35_9CHLR|nr:RodZ domain-containing protein [Longilinea arvoryzae]GAP14165.1 hypothetical protein LARV_01931 [Longilinea arvoryzae]
MPQTIGEQLKQAREDRGLSLEQAAQVTRVRIHYLKALEGDQRDQLPSAVQGRGFLRLYADYLGLPVQTLLDQWEGRTPVETIPEAVPLPVEEIPAADIHPLEPTTDEVEEEPVEPAAQTTGAEEEVEGQVEEEPAESEPAPDAGEIIQVSPHVERPDAPPTQNSDAILSEIGNTLRQRRESISLSISDVEHYTKLRQHYLRALEAGRIDDLPSAVQGRGMLSNYAEFLNLDVDVLLSRFADALQARRIELQPATQPRASRPIASRPLPTLGKQPISPDSHTPASRAKAPATRLESLARFITPDLMVIGSLIIVLVVFVIWAASRITSLSASDVEPTTRPLSEVLLETSEPSITATLAPTQTTPIPLGLTNPTAIMGTAVEEGTQLPNSNSPIQVNVVAIQRAWMKITIDGKVAFSGRVIPGNAYPYSGSEKIELLTGNAAGLQVVYNQDDLGILGSVGQVVDLIFLADSMITPTPAFTATPTPTQEATLTLQPTATLPTPTITPFVP